MRPFFCASVLGMARQIIRGRQGRAKIAIPGFMDHEFNLFDHPTVDELMFMFGNDDISRARRKRAARRETPVD